jgi:hypothetical protein
MCNVEMALKKIVAMLSEFNFTHGQPSTVVLCVSLCVTHLILTLLKRDQHTVHFKLVENDQ